MALSMDEQRILAQIEEYFASRDPAFAARLSSFGRSGGGRKLRLPRARMAGSAAVLVAVAIASLVVYALLPLRDVPARPRPQPATTAGAVMASHTRPALPSQRAASPTAAIGATPH